MPALRKPTAVLEATGAFKEHPARARTGEPNSGRGIGPAPAWLTPEQGEIWDEVVSDCAAGVFQSSDRHMLAALVIHLEGFRNAPADFGHKRMTALMSLLARCGMTPADRSRITVARSEVENPKVGLARFR